jgi:hypothetical protein
MNLLGGLFDKEGMVKATIETCLENIAEELECKATELFIMIKPTDEEFNFKCWVYKMVEGNPKVIRQITLKEILGDNE